MERDKPSLSSTSPVASTAAAAAAPVAPVPSIPPHAESSSKPDDAPNLPGLLRSAVDKALTFLGTASNEALCACAAGLGVTTYFVLGRVGLVIIGLVGGVVLHATWEVKSNQDVSADAASRKRELGVDVLRRVLDWRERAQAASLIASPIKEEEDFVKTADFSSFPQLTAVALNELTDAIVRDYIKWWYSPILPADAAFPSACQQILASFISSLSSNMSKKRPAEAFLEFTTNSSSVVIVVLNELTVALSASPGSTPENAIRTYLRLKPQSSLANILDQKHQQRKLKMISDDILENYLDSSVYRCSPTRIFLREMFANVVLEMSLQQCSQAEFINDWIVYLLEEGEPEIMKEIDAGVGNASNSQGLGIKKQVTIQEESTESSKPRDEQKPGRDHKRRVSRAEEAMDEAMKEAQRLTQMILEEEERKAKEQKAETTPIQLPGEQAADSVQQLGEPASTPTPQTLKPETAPTTSASQTNLSEASDTTHPGNGIHTPTSSSGDLMGLANMGSNSRAMSDGTPELLASPPDNSPKVSSGPTQETFAERMASIDEMKPIAEEGAATKQTLTLINAKVSIFDDLFGGDKRPLKVKPGEEFLIQVEPASSDFAGWIVARTYADFEVLHEVLRRIATISGATFTQNHGTLPSWKGINKAYLKDELERYLGDAVRFESLAESEGMKRFLERDRALQKANPRGGAFWPNPANVGKGMLDVLSKAPREVAGGGKAFFGGVTSALTGGAGNRATSTAQRPGSISHSPLRSESQTSLHQPRLSMQADSSGRPTSAVNGSPPPPADTRSSTFPNPFPEVSRSSIASRSSNTSEPAAHSAAFALASAEQPRRRSETPEMALPPPPELMPDDYVAPKRGGSNKLVIPEHTSHFSVDGTSFFDLPPSSTPAVSPKPSPSPVEPSVSRSQPRRSPVRGPKRERPSPKPKQPLSEQEAQVTVELMFAVISELYTLSSAWNIRRTLLTAAKTFLLRPGNPQLESIRVLLQESVLDANTSDAGVAALLVRLRENVMPTAEEKATWPEPRSEEQREELRKKARKLLVQRGMPQALTSVMGVAASGEALGKVFDCLQVDEVARGVMFGLLLQLVRAITQ